LFHSAASLSEWILAVVRCAGLAHRRVSPDHVGLHVIERATAQAIASTVNVLTANGRCIILVMSRVPGHRQFVSRLVIVDAVPHDGAAPTTGR
jgi:hypothetical protein